MTPNGSPSHPPFLDHLGEAERSLIAHAKRFVQRYKGDPAFRAGVAEDARAAAREYGIGIDPEEIRPLWDIEAAQARRAQGLPMPPATQLCLRFDQEVMIGWAMRHRTATAFSDPRMGAWWERQVARNATELGPEINANNIHAPVTFELCAGCSVGCWFCGLSAERLQAVFAYDEDNRRLWRGVLEVVRDLVGPAAQAGFCYWATEPFDNPDYERFLLDYHDIIGALPSTTTALAAKNIERVRRLIGLWEGRTFVANHFSILTVKHLDAIHSAFAPEELLFTGMKFVNKGATTRKATAGKALEKLRDQAAGKGGEEDVSGELTQGTIACVTGFLFNMVSRKVMLVTPCKASDRWPKGYKVLEEAVFRDAGELRDLMEGMIATHMRTALAPADRVRFREDLVCEPLPDGFHLRGEFLSRDFRHPLFGARLGELLREGRHSLEEIMRATAALGQPGEVAAALDALFRGGVLQE